MRKVMLGAILVWCLCAVEASYYENNDYWYSNDDGMILDSLSPASLYRSRNENVTSILRSHDDIPTERIRKIYPERNRTYLRTFTAPPFKKNPVLLKLEKKRTPEETWSCSDGPSMILDCNHCICIGGQLYLCTAKRCLHPDSTGIQVLKSYREKRLDDCIEGEHIQSFDCNKCWCSGGKIICTKKKCKRGERETERSITDDRCVPGEPLPSPDSCNTCGCTMRGEKYCTATGCGIKPKVIKDRDVGCVPQTWFSLYGSSTCKECYCTDGKMAFCYLKLCAAERIQYRGYDPQKLMSVVKSGSCNKGAVMFDECSRCVCTYKEQWKCFTRLIDKCSGAEKGSQKKTPKPNKKKGNQNNNKESKHPKISADDKKKKEIDGLLNEYWKDPKTKTSFNPEDNKKPGKNDENKSQLGNNDGGKPSITEKTNRPSLDNSIDVDITTERPKKNTNTPKKNKKKPKSRKPKSTTPIESFESVDVDDISRRFRGFRRPRPRRPIKTTRRPVRTTRRTVKTTRSTEKTTRQSYDFDIDLPSECEMGQLFTQGYASNCQGCFCTVEGKWNCFSLAGPCREWKGCLVGAYEKNTQIPCSVCYCGADGKFMCAVDEDCSQELKPSSCENSDCVKTCLLKQLNGFCHRDKCTCI